MRPVRAILPARAKTFVPLLFSVPIEAYQAPPLRTIGAMLAKVSTLLMRVGWPQRPLVGRVGRARPRRAAVALDRGDEGRLLAADEGAGADADVDAEAEAGVEDAAAQELQPSPPA